MKILHLGVMLLVIVWAAQASALTVDDIERLKKAGVSDAVIQKMIEQEGAGVKATGAHGGDRGPGHLQRGAREIRSAFRETGSMNNTRRKRRWTPCRGSS